MPLLKRRADDNRELRTARFQVDEAIKHMSAVLDKVEKTAVKAKEEIDERRAGG